MYKKNILNLEGGDGMFLVLILIFIAYVSFKD